MGGERPALRDWRGETCAARLAGRDLSVAIGRERVQETCAAQLAASDLRGERPDGRRATSLNDLCRALRAMGCIAAARDLRLMFHFFKFLFMICHHNWTVTEINN